jgi:hypothetical protein
MTIFEILDILVAYNPTVNFMTQMERLIPGYFLMIYGKLSFVHVFLGRFYSECSFTPNGRACI